jgi:hypothetical protein
MSKRNQTVIDSQALLNKISNLVIDDSFGMTKEEYAQQITEWRQGAEACVRIFTERIQTWGIMVDRIQQGDLDGMRALQ